MERKTGLSAPARQWFSLQTVVCLSLHLTTIKISIKTTETHCKPSITQHWVTSSHWALDGLVPRDVLALHSRAEGTLSSHSKGAARNQPIWAQRTSFKSGSFVSQEGEVLLKAIGAPLRRRRLSEPLTSERSSLSLYEAQRSSGCFQLLGFEHNPGTDDLHNGSTPHWPKVCSYHSAVLISASFARARLYFSSHLVHKPLKFPSLNSVVTLTKALG